jgi:hypothetical protein
MWSICIILRLRVGKPDGAHWSWRQHALPKRRTVLADYIVSYPWTLQPSRSTPWEFKAPEMKFDIWVFFKNSVVKIQISLKSDNASGVLHEYVCAFMLISRWILLRMRNVSDISRRQNQKTHLMFNNFFPENRVTLRYNLKKYMVDRQARDENVIWCIHSFIYLHSVNPYMVCSTHRI